MEYLVQEHVVSRQNNLLLFKGVLAIIWGVTALLSTVLNPMVLIYGFGALNLVAALLTFGYAYINRHLKISHQWLILEGIVELAAGIVFLMLVSNIADFVQLMSYGIIFIVTLQFIYGFVLVLRNQMQPINLVARFASVIAGTIISVGLMSQTFSITLSFLIIGLFSILYGILNIQFSLKLKNVVMGHAE